MANSSEQIPAFNAALADHLAWWGLRRFESDAAYFQWQRDTLSSHDLKELNRLAEAKRAPGATSAETAFYDVAATSHILPVLYSQRYDYYNEVGPIVVERIGEARTILDFGCGIGLLTTFYARQFPGCSFVGVDRSAASLAIARERAKALRLSNLRFDCLDLEQTPLDDGYELIVCTQALLQSERDPGLPSLDWRTFERARDPMGQSSFEQRTGVGGRLDRLCAGLRASGRMLVFEKTRQVARRVPFQRALAARGLWLLEVPIPVRYRLVEEVADDGPLFHLTNRVPLALPDSAPVWDEAPEHLTDEELHHCRGEGARFAWERLPQRQILKEATWDNPALGSLRAEWGRSGGALGYLYVTAGDRFTGLVVGCLGSGRRLECEIGRHIEAMGKNPAALEAWLESAWPPSVSRDHPSLTPLYENHTASAQAVWLSLADRRTLQTSTFDETPGLQMHVELGETPGLMYLYGANTLDQRQLVVMEPQRAELLEQYYHELLTGRLLQRT